MTEWLLAGPPPWSSAAIFSPSSDEPNDAPSGPMHDMRKKQTTFSIILFLFQFLSQKPSILMKLKMYVDFLLIRSVSVWCWCWWGCRCSWSWWWWWGGGGKRWKLWKWWGWPGPGPGPRRTRGWGRRRKEERKEREKERRIEKWKYGKESDRSMPPSLLLPLLLSSPLCWLPSCVDLQGSNSWVSEFQRKPEHHPQDWYRCNLTFWYGAGNGRCLPVRVQSSNRILFIFQPIARTKTHRISFFQFLYPAEALVRGTLQNPSPLQPVLFKWPSKEQPNLKQPAPSWYHGTYRISMGMPDEHMNMTWYKCNTIYIYNLCDIWYNLI